MFARTTTFEADPTRVDAGIAFVRDEVMPTLTGMDGCIGMSLTVDRSSGRCIATSSWHDEASLQASDPRVRPLRDRGSELFGTAPTVQVWDIALLHRLREAPAGAYVRASWTKGDPARTDELVDLVRTEVIPHIEQLQGFCSASLFVDRSRGLGALSVTYDSKASLDATRGTAGQLRTRVIADGGLDLLDVAELELVLAHLRVPETV